MPHTELARNGGGGVVRGVDRTLGGLAMNYPPSNIPLIQL
jgi:hypothetical protein